MTHRCVSCNHDPLYLLFRYLFFLKKLPDQFLKILPDTALHLPFFPTIRCRNSRKHIRAISSLVINGYGSLAVCFCFQIHKQCRQSRCSDVDADSIKCIFCFLCRSFCCIFVLYSAACFRFCWCLGISFCKSFCVRFLLLLPL